MVGPSALPVPRKGAGPYAFDNAVRRAGFPHVAGLDEAGRGACAGPLYAAAVVLAPHTRISELADSKLLTPAARERVEERVKRLAVAWAVAAIDVAELDEIGLHRANLVAFRRAWQRLPVRPDYALCDGFVPGGLGRPQLAVWKGDMVSATIAAASVLAKCARDREMVALHQRHPEYGFDVHKGYTTSAHRDALAQFGPSPVHRHRFITVRRAIREGAA
ncbi:MAG TPA: ribonuclease HII [Actinomycetota bacterium]|nr:MAG: ribonuclease HII [Actinomycetota bacterium]HUM87604.1 ribonuclease HII [Actinomycetota bacterium]